MSPASAAAAPSAPASTPHEDRRNSQRIRAPFTAEVSEWLGSRIGATFSVLIEDISTTGVRILHSGRLQVGARYLIDIPRPGRRPIGAVFTVVRCDEGNGGASFEAHLEPDDVLDLAVRASLLEAERSGEQPPPPRSTGARIAALAATLLVATAAATLLLLFR